MRREADYSWRKKRRKADGIVGSGGALRFLHSLLLLRAIPILLLLLFPRPTRAVNDQGQALLAWKRTLDGGSGHVPVLSDWNPSEASPCRWHGITCDPTTGRVVELNLNYTDLRGGVPAMQLVPALTSLKRLALSGANLSGTIPPQLGLLPELAVLDLSGNSLTGIIPPELFRPGSKLEELYLYSNRLEGGIPEEVGDATSLRWLVLYDNQLSGVVPRSIGKLAALEVLRAGGNKNLHGPIPAEIGSCANLTMVGLAETSISGSLPPSLGRLKRLDTLAVYTAMLSGPIPPELGQCESLRSVYLYENSLSGEIPPEFANLKNLRNLLLWQNELVGVIPPGLGGCTELVVVDLSMNTLTGSVPASLGNLTNLRQLQLSVNQFSGSIPPELGNCTSLTDLEMDNNLIGGGIPPEIGRLRSLQTLYLWQNRLEGGIPPELGGCEELEAMDLSQNYLTGAIPAGIFGLRRLNKLLLLNNQLSGPIPPEIGNCTSLLRFRANANRLAGAIPPEIGMLRNLSFLDLGDNRLTGVIPPQLSACQNLTFLDLHSNQISGDLLPAISGLVSLQFLDVSNNSIGGPLDRRLGSLTSLTKVKLAGNRFTGEIPQEIGSCVKLQSLDLSGNWLSGSIPATIGKLESLEICLNLSMNALSGDIPSEFAGLVRLGVLDLSHNHLSGDLRALAELQNLVALNLSYNNFSGPLPPSLFFSKLPVADLEGNPGLCLNSRCSGASARGGAETAAAKAARIATAVLLSTASVLLAVALLGYVMKRKVFSHGSTKGGGHGDEELDLGPPWEVTLFQKMDISVADVTRGMTAANVIGKGWSGTVYRATIPSGQTIAVKRFRTCDDAASAAFGAEISVLAQVRHRNIVRLLGWGANRKTRLLFYDYLPNNTLGATLRGGSGGVGGGIVLEWETRLDIALGLAEGLSYLHHDCVPGILHRDVKSDNVLLGERYEACLADFGLARVAEDEHGGLTSAGPHLAGSYGYMAPEYGCMMRITRKSDVYSFGVVLLELITGRRAVDGGAYGEWQSIVGWSRDHLRAKKDPVELLDPRMQGRPDGQVQEMLQALGIALLCCSNRADDRPSMKDVAALLREIRHDGGGGGGGGCGDGKNKRVGSDTWRRDVGTGAGSLVGLPPSARGSPAYTPSHSSSNVFDV